MGKDNAKAARREKASRGGDIYGCGCDICGSEMRFLRKLSADTAIYYCKKDDLYKAARSLPPRIESDAAYFEFLTDFRKNSIRKILDELPKHLIGKSGIAQGLEVGCGPGLFMEMAKVRGYSMLGMEPSSGAYRITKEKSLNVIQGMFPEDLPESLTFDFIIFNDVFEHLLNADAALSCCAHHLKPKGVICINIPVSSGMIFRVANALVKFNLVGDSYRRLWQIGTPSPHQYYFSRKSINALANKRHLEISGILVLDAIERSFTKTYKRLRGYNELAADETAPGPITAACMAVGLRAINAASGLWGGDVNCFFLKVKE